MRLQKRRIELGYSTAAEAARAFGWNATTYRAHESGGRGLTVNEARKYARAYRVSVAWLLDGEGNKSKIINLANKIGSFRDIPALEWIALTATTTLKQALSVPGLPVQSVPADIPVDNETAILTANDDSMVNNTNASLPSFPQGNKLLFSAGRKPRPGDYVLCLPFGAPRACFRQYVLDSVDDEGREIIKLVALNSTYPSYIMSAARPGIIFGCLIARIDLY